MPDMRVIASAEFAQILHMKSIAIEREWIKRFRSQVLAVSGIDDILLLNSFPAYLERLNTALKNSIEDEGSFLDTLSIAREHGRERAKVHGYMSRDI